MYKRQGLKGKIITQETLTVIRSRSGEKASSESITEFAYPTKFAPPELPNNVGVAITTPVGKDQPIPLADATKLKNAPSLDSLSGIKTPATPTRFETRNFGTIVEYQARLDAETNLVDLRISQELVTFSGYTKSGQGLSLTKMPEFETQSLFTAINAHVGQPFLLGTLNRPSISKLDPDSANKVFYAFVTVRLVKP